MFPSKIYPITLAASATYSLLVQGQYFKILSATGAVNIVSDFGRLDGLTFGQGLENTPFSYLTITNATAATNTISLFVGDENFIDAITGSVQLIGQQGAVTQAAATVTNASGQLLAAKTTRKYLLIQNKDTAGDIYVNLAGSAATTANGIKVPAGGALEMSDYLPTAAIFAIGSIASNANIVVVEG